MVSAAEVADALAGLRGPVPVRFAWQRRTLAYQFIDTISQATVATAAPRLDLDNDRAVLRSLRGIELLESALSALPGGPFDPTSDNVAVVEQRYIVGQWRDFPLGVYRLEVGDTCYGADGVPVLECAAADLATILTESGPSTSYTVSSATSYQAAVAAVIEGRGLVHGLEAVAATLPTDVTWPPYPETTWWQVVHDLADGINYRTPWPDPTGRFVWRAQDVDPSQATPAATYTDADEPRLVDGDTPYRRRQSAGSLANVAAVLIADPTHPDFGYVLRENADPTSPISTAHRPERRVEVRADSRPASTRAVLDVATAAGIAEARLRREAGRFHTARLTTLPDPRRGAHEYYRLRIRQTNGEPVEDGTLWRVARWSRELAPGGRHRHELERVTPVTLIDPEVE